MVKAKAHRHIRAHKHTKKHTHMHTNEDQDTLVQLHTQHRYICPCMCAHTHGNMDKQTPFQVTDICVLECKAVMNPLMLSS